VAKVEHTEAIALRSLFELYQKSARESHAEQSVEVPRRNFCET
jgi:hypothetical protein